MNVDLVKFIYVCVYICMYVGHGNQNMTQRHSLKYERFISVRVRAGKGISVLGLIPVEPFIPEGCQFQPYLFLCGDWTRKSESLLDPRVLSQDVELVFSSVQIAFRNFPRQVHPFYVILLYQVSLATVTNYCTCKWLKTTEIHYLTVLKVRGLPQVSLG